VNDIDDDDRPPEWVGGLRPAVPPPEAVKARVVEALRGGGLLARKPGRVRRAVFAAAAGLALAAAGWLAGSVARAPTGSPGSPAFMLLLFGGDAAPSGEAARVAEYRDWARSLAGKGRRVSGERLADGAVAVGAGDPPGGGALKGFFIIEARSIEEAEALAAAHPHVRHGGSIVIRRIATGG
jgi:hypothetical protein